MVTKSYYACSENSTQELRECQLAKYLESGLVYIEHNREACICTMHCGKKISWTCTQLQY